MKQPAQSQQLRRLVLDPPPQGNLPNTSLIAKFAGFCAAMVDSPYMAAKKDLAFFLPGGCPSWIERSLSYWTASTSSPNRFALAFGRPIELVSIAQLPDHYRGPSDAAIAPLCDFSHLPVSSGEITVIASNVEVTAKSMPRCFPSSL
jgi:hypothetical protein